MSKTISPFITASQIEKGQVVRFPHPNNRKQRTAVDVTNTEVCDNGIYMWVYGFRARVSDGTRTRRASLEAGNLRVYTRVSWLIPVTTDVEIIKHKEEGQR